MHPKKHIIAIIATVALGAVTPTVANDAQAELEATIEMMRAQGWSEERIEEFRRLAGGVMANQESEEEKRARREQRAKERSERAFEETYGDEPDVIITLGGKEFILKRTLCRADPDNFAITASDRDAKEAAIFRLWRNSTHLNTHNTEFRFEAGDTYTSVSPAPWSYANGVYTFESVVTAYTLFGPTSARGQSEEQLLLKIVAPCE